MSRFHRDRRQLIAGVSLSLIAIAVACGSGNGDPGSPTPTATPLAGQRAPTAEATIPPTPNLNPAPTATGVATATSPSSANTATPVQPTDTGFSAPGTPPPSATPASAPTSPPLPSPTPVVIESGKELVNEPLGVLQLRPGNGRAIQFSPGVNTANFRVNVGFSNPFHPDFSPWDYGLKFRDDGDSYQMFVLDHNGNLSYIKGKGSELQIVDTAPARGMLTVGGGRNDLNFLVIEDRAFIFLDGLLIKIYAVEGTGISGEVSLVTDIYNQTVVVGAQTRFFDLLINSAGLVGRVNSGQMIRPAPDEVALGEFSLPTSAGYARVTLVSPLNAFSGDYSFGLLFRTEATGIDNWLVFDDSKRWRHIRRSTTGAEFLFANGVAQGLNARQGSENLLEFLSTGQENKVYLNGELLLNISLLPEDLPFTIAPVAGFEAGHQTGGLATQYSDFAVWSVAR